MHREPQILKLQHFRKLQIAILWGTDSEQLQQELPQMEKAIGMQIPRPVKQAQIPTKGSKYGVGHNLYCIQDILIQANDQAFVKVCLAIAVPEGTYRLMTPKSGLATKGISEDAGVIDADYEGKVKVLLVRHRKLE